jgi:hypothetical protein
MLRTDDRPLDFFDVSVVASTGREPKTILLE